MDYSKIRQQPVSPGRDEATSSNDHVAMNEYRDCRGNEQHDNSIPADNNAATEKSVIEIICNEKEDT